VRRLRPISCLRNLCSARTPAPQPCCAVAVAAPCVHTHEPERGIALPKYPVIFMKTTATLNCHLGDIWRPNMTGEEDALNPGDSRLLAAARERFSKFCVFPLLGPEFPAGPSRQQESLSASWPLCDWLLCAVHDGDGGPGRGARMQMAALWTTKPSSAL
jgi:hypothetical protein